MMGMYSHCLELEISRFIMVAARHHFFCSMASLEVLIYGSHIGHLAHLLLFLPGQDTMYGLEIIEEIVIQDSILL